MTRFIFFLIGCIILTSAVDVSVMLPLDMVDFNGNLAYSDKVIRNWFYDLRNASVAGVMTDVWHGLTEPQPHKYHFDPYIKLITIARETGLKVQLVASFHRCGGNVGDTCDIPLPKWILDVGKSNSNIFYTDKHGHPDEEYLSLGVDNERLFGSPPRSPVEIYSDWVHALAKAIRPFIPTTVDEFQIGLGPCGELRYPSYQLDRWGFCGVGEFQCWDKYMLESLKKAADAYGKPWYLPPGDAGEYNSRPDDTGFFRTNGGYASEYGNFFLKWYSGQLMDHFDRVLGAIRSKLGSLGLSDFPLAVKIAGIHWHYNHASHAAELTAGYFNTNGVDGYAKMMPLFKKHNVAFDFTCLEMRDWEQPGECNCSPWSLVGQTIKGAKINGLTFSGENAIAGFEQNKFDTMIENVKRYGKGSVKQITFLRLGDSMFYPDNYKRMKSWVERIAEY
ncbi:hypothetical protein GEMRC1_009093 [Eukaryota sp. GEM-RC1]